jgi:hypothetical protein
MYIQYINSVTFANCLSSSYDITQHKCGLITQYTEELLGNFDKQSFAMAAYNNHGKNSWPNQKLLYIFTAFL